MSRPSRELLTLKRRAHPSGRDADPRRTIPLNSAAWQKLRAAVLTREPLCRMCKTLGIVELATNVDHLSGDPSDNSAENLQPLCHACHSHKTGRERAGLAVQHGCDANGWPQDPNHAWNQSEKSPEASPAQTGRPPLFQR